MQFWMEPQCVIFSYFLLNVLFVAGHEMHVDSNKSLIIIPPLILLKLALYASGQVIVVASAKF